MKPRIALNIILFLLACAVCLAGCTPEHERALDDDNHLTRLLQDLQKPGLICVYDEDTGLWHPLGEEVE